MNTVTEQHFTESEVLALDALVVITHKEFVALDILSKNFELAFNALPDNIKLAYFNWLVGMQS